MKDIWKAIKGIFSRKDGILRTIRALLLGLAAFSVTPEGQATLAAIAGTWAPLISVILAALGGYTAVGEPNPKDD